MIWELTLIHAFDLFGTFIFALTGAVKGVRCKLDILGVVVFATTVGCGGGMFRDMLIGATPAAVLVSSSYIIICVVTGLLVFFLAPKIVGRWPLILYADALGLGVFTALGCAKGALYGLSPIGQILSGMFSAVVGGVVRDVLSRSVPTILTSDFYATASLIGAMLYIFLVKTSLGLFELFIIVTLTVFILRIVALKLNINLPVADTALPVDDHETMGK